MRGSWLWALLMCQNVWSQDAITLQEIGELNPLMHETSGLTRVFNQTNGNFEIWTHNDKDNTDSIYSVKLDDVNQITRILDVGIANADWEDMAQDEAGDIYIGDFGSGNSGAWKIVKIPDPNSYPVHPNTAEEIYFTFSESGVTDIEAMVVLRDSIYLFTKAINPGANPAFQEGYCYAYRLPKSAAGIGSPHTAVRIGSFQTQITGDLDPSDYRITGADLSPDKQILVLLGYQRLWIFSCFQGTQFFEGAVQYVTYPKNQKEGVQFISNHELVISKEGKIGTGSIPKMFYADIEPWIDDACLNCEKIQNGFFEQGTDGWILYTHNSAVAQWEVINETAVIEVIDTGSSRWHVGLQQKGRVFQPGRTYSVSFEAYAEDDRDMSVFITDDAGSGIDYQLVDLSTQPEFFEYTFTPASYEYNARITFGVGKPFMHQVFISNLSIVATDCICPPNRSINAAIISGQNRLLAQDAIELSNSILGNSTDWTFGANLEINLSAGFEISNGASITLLNDGCRP